MADKKPGVIRRIFRFIGSIIDGIRTIIGLVVLGFFVLVIAGMFADNIQPVPDSGALYLAPSGFLVDQKSYTDPFNQLFSGGSSQDNETLVRDITEALDTARTDSRITHVVLDTDYMAGAGLSKLAEVSGALLRFKRSGKPIIALGDNFNQQQYFLAAHADEILLNPLGGVMITGFGSYNSYYKEALDKLKINMHIFRVGTYKSGVEPYLGNAMSAEVKQERSLLLNELWQFYGSAIESLRELPDGAIDNYANNLHLNLRDVMGDSSALAKQQNLVDQVVSRTEAMAYLNDVIPGKDGEFDSINLKGYLNNIRLAKVSSAAQRKHKIALVVASGTILDGEQPEGTVGGDTLAGIFSQLREDSDVKAVVLRVDSPGGSAFASEIIRDAMAATRKQGIPIVISMGSVAASGGYWIATEADRVFAMPTTITGSIGVYAVIPTVEDSMAALGIYSDGVGTTDIAGMMQLDRPMTKQTELILQAGVDNIYSRFLTLVSESRDSTAAEVHEVAQGRVWTGTQALELGLVDELGDLNDAIEAAAKIANLTEYMVDYQRKPLTAYEQLMSELNSNISVSVMEAIQSALPNSLTQQAKTILKPFNMLDNLNDPRGIYLHCEECPL
jgi:protease-4